jgi:DNA-binding CsgD family transcriptional regulator
VVFGCVAVDHSFNLNCFPALLILCRPGLLNLNPRLMSASLCIQVSSSVRNTEPEEINFFETGEWSADSEKELLIRIQDILSVTRSIGVSFEIKISMEVTDTEAAIFFIKKKTAAHFAINNQKLSVREIEILGLIMQGLTNHEIAKKLFISFETVRSHRKNILEKSGAKNTAALINYYHQTFFEK